ncbi:MAG: hypothetical protein A2Y17_02500 [Clostridiales bacterium GWF2_38_85]|nr:MAG: hypothetical protein A2Y17_02500 [Clostridiales bacterium GWF2_38_85]HBL85068.1 hypothetical protein [Clostridiales bacterium]
MLIMSMYMFVRIFVTAVFALVAFFVFWKKIKKLKLFGYLIAISLFFAVISFLPFENVFYKFDSPEAAYKYQTNKNPKEVISTDEFSVVMYQRNNLSVATYISDKSGSGWKIPFVFNEQGKSIDLPYEYHNLSARVCRTFGSEKSILVIAEYFVEDTTSDLMITDSLGSEFTVTSNIYPAEEGNIIVHYVIVDSDAKDYKLFINGIKVEAVINLK